jgi:carbon monoxide dehydrogenase subunit G
VRTGGERTFAVARETVWTVLVRPEAIARTLPGVERFEVHDDEHWSAYVRFRLGLASIRLEVRFELVEQQEPEFARVVAHGRGVGGKLRMDTSFRLRAEADGTEMDWSAEVSLVGPFGPVNARLLRPLVDRQVARLFDSLEHELRTARA